MTGEWAWFQSRTITVPDRTWTTLKWDVTWGGHNGLGLVISPDGTVTPPDPDALYDLDWEVAFENVHGLPLHRRKTRYIDAQYGLAWAQDERTSVPTNGTSTNDDLQPQTILCGFQPNGEPFKIQVWQNSGQPLKCVHYLLHAPSLMMVKISP